jgi:hypothetical protein
LDLNVFQKPLDNGYHRICVVSINTLGLGLEIRGGNTFLGALSKSGLMNKHIVKHIVLGLVGLMPSLGCPIPVQVRTNKQTYRETLAHEQTYRETYRDVILGALCLSKSGLEYTTGRV